MKTSRRTFLGLAIGGITVGGLAVLALPRHEGDSSTQPDPTEELGTAQTPTASSPTPAGPAATPTAAPASRDLDHMIGQMIMAGFVGTGLSNAVQGYVTSGHLGNAVLFGPNVTSPSQVAKLDASLQSAAATPMLISTDEEGGAVARLDDTNGFPATVSARYLGSLNDLSVTKQYAGSMAASLAQSGINLNLAPVVDVDVNPNNPVIGAYGRSFSPDPDVVTQQAMTFIQAHHQQGVSCTLKHFPGHGSSTADSHLDFVDVTQTWSRRELLPFQRLIQAGVVDAIMTAHIFNAQLDPNYPATLSKQTISGLLRGELGYDGVVLSDDMEMGAISKYYGFEAAIELSINAGVDIISIAGSGQTERAFEAIQNAVAAGRISQQRVEESYLRICRLKHIAP